MRPSTDTAVMLGLAHGLLVSGMHDEDFLESYCVGWDRLRAYLGKPDGVPKTPDWAGSISGVDSDRIRALAVEMAAMNTDHGQLVGAAKRPRGAAVLDGGRPGRDAGSRSASRVVASATATERWLA